MSDEEYDYLLGRYDELNRLYEEEKMLSGLLFGTVESGEALRLATDRIKELEAENLKLRNFINNHAYMEDVNANNP
jgi:hypothetical protein